MTLPGCASLCPLNEFINLTKDVVPENWERECLIGWDEITSNDVIGNYYFPYFTLSIHNFPSIMQLILSYKFHIIYP